MVEYINAELYKVSRRKYPYITVGIMAVLELLLVLLWGWIGRSGDGMANITSSSGFSMILGMLSMGFYGAMIASDMVFSEQYKHNTLKNEVSYGLPRSRIYLGKLAAEMAVSLVICLLVFLWYGLLCRFLLPADGEWFEVLKAVGAALMTALPLWLGCLALIHMLFFTMKSTTAAAILAAVTLTAAGQLLRLIATLVALRWEALGELLMGIHRILLTSPLEKSVDVIAGGAALGEAWVIGAGWFLAATLAGLTAFRKKEIS